MTTETVQKRLDEFNILRVSNKQDIGNFTIVAQELDKILYEYMNFTFSSEDFKNTLKNKFGGNINQFNQNLILFALTLEHMEKVADENKEIKNLLPTLKEKRKILNKNIEKVAKDLGYNVSYYSIDKLMNKDLNEVKEELKKDFGVEPKFEGTFNTDVLNSLSDFFEFIVRKFYTNINKNAIGIKDYEKETSIKALKRKEQDIKKDSLSNLKEILENKDKNTRREALPILEKALKNPDTVIRKEAIFYLEVALLSSHEPEDILDFYKVSLESPYKDVRMKSTKILKKILTNGRQ